MKLGVYSVRDAAVDAWLTPFFARTDGEAVRSFSDACMDVKHQFALHARDYCLYRIGWFDDSTGAVVSDAYRLVEATSFQLTASAVPSS